MSYDAGHLVVRAAAAAIRIRLQSRQARPVAYSPVHDLEDRFQNTKNLEEGKQWISNVSIRAVFVRQSREFGKDSVGACFSLELGFTLLVKGSVHPTLKSSIACSTPKSNTRGS
jgi:hypothetical protein